MEIHIVFNMIIEKILPFVVYQSRDLEILKSGVVDSKYDTIRLTI